MSDASYEERASKAFDDEVYADAVYKALKALNDAIYAARERGLYVHLDIDKIPHFKNPVTMVSAIVSKTFKNDPER